MGRSNGERRVAKAVFQRNQKVWVESVGAWAMIEKIVPVWAKGFDEPVKVTYDVGLGREFQAHELKAEQDGDAAELTGPGRWRLLRARNKWQSEEDAAHHPYPGTYPVVVTDEADWGGWRVPGAEYDRDPNRIEAQARLITCAPRLLMLAREAARIVDESAGDAPPELQGIAEEIAKLDRRIREAPAAAPATTKVNAEPG